MLSRLVITFLPRSKRLLISWLQSPSAVISPSFIIIVASLVAQMVKNLTAMQETWVQSPGWEDALEKEMATLEKSMDRGTWQATVNVVAMSWTQMSD